MKVRHILRAMGAMLALALAVFLAIEHRLVSLPRPRSALPPALMRVRIAVHAPEREALLYLAKSRGAFDARGVDVTLQSYANEAEALEALANGSVQLATSSDFAFANAILRSGKVAALATLAHAYTSQIVGRRDRGIVSTSDLKGRRIGVTRHGTGEFLLSRFLAVHDLRIDDAKLLDIPAAEMTQALVDGRIDAAFASEPHVFEIRSRLGLKAISWPATSTEEFYMLLLGQSAWIPDHAAMLQHVLAALIETEQYIDVDPHGAKTALAAQLGFGRDYIDSVWRRCSYEVALPQALVLALEDASRWSLRQRPVPGARMPNFLRAIAMDPLDGLRPDLITIIR